MDAARRITVYFESVGHYFFTPEDWSVLCERVLPSLDLLHVEQPHVPDGSAYPNIFSRHTHTAEPTGLVKLHGGRIYASRATSTQWCVDHEIEWRPTYDGCRSTAYLRRQFLAQADPEGDFRISRGLVPEWLPSEDNTDYVSLLGSSNAESQLDYATLHEFPEWNCGADISHVPLTDALTYLREVFKSSDAEFFGSCSGVDVSGYIKQGDSA